MEPKETRRLFPDKYAEYFSTINPLAAKIYADIKKVEDNYENFSTLSYDEKCAVIDKHLLSPESSHPDSRGTDYFDTIGHGELPKTGELLMSVYPKKTDKYIYDENNVWEDEHSACYTACSESQVAACNLDKLVRQISFRPQQPKRASVLKKGKAPAPNRPSSATTSALNKTEETITATTTIKDESSKFLAGHDDDDDDLLPKQKQNSDLIAELQAKLKKNKPEIKSPTTDAVSVPVKSQPTTIAPKISKPKGRPPPPPPPVQKAEKTVVKEVSKPKQSVADDEFVVDISSPCRIATPKTGFDFLDNW